MSTPKDKNAAAWQQFMSMLTPRCKTEVQNTECTSVLSTNTPDDTIEDEETAQYMAFRATLSAAAAEQLDALFGDSEDDSVEVNDKLARYCLIECPDGGWSTVRMFKNKEDLARRLGRLEGEDMVVWAMFGVPLRLTKGPQRYLLLPDGMTALTIPIIEGGPVKTIEADLLDQIELQDDGYVGPPELAQAHTVADEDKKHKTTPNKSKQMIEDDYLDDDDDEDELA